MRPAGGSLSHTPPGRTSAVSAAADRSIARARVGCTTTARTRCRGPSAACCSAASGPARTVGPFRRGRSRRLRRDGRHRQPCARRGHRHELLKDGHGLARTRSSSACPITRSATTTRTLANNIPIKRFLPAGAALDPAPSDQDLIDIALDCVSPTGVTSLRSSTPLPRRPSSSHATGSRATRLSRSVPLSVQRANATTAWTHVTMCAGRGNLYGTGSANAQTLRDARRRTPTLSESDRRRNTLAPETETETTGKIIRS